MRKPTVSTTVLGAAALLGLAGPATAHSWIERAFKIAPNGTLIGAEGFPRGWVSRNSTDPLWNDSLPQWLLPYPGNGAYKGDEFINKYPKQENPQFPMLEAASGDHIALMHLENGHTTLPKNQPYKPKNRGTLFFYGTSEPKEQERLFDVHLVWNRKGTGGDGRGRLLATRNYDDGRCYQPNSGEISLQRATELAPEGAVHATELACQSDVKLPDNLTPGSIYTIYWYWDWPDLNENFINVAATTNGIFPWAGTFMRGEKDPHNFTMAAISKNESYASTIDIKITGGDQVSVKHTTDMSQWVAKQDIYSMAIEEQMTSNYQVDIDANGDGSPSNSKNNVSSASTSTSCSGSKTAPDAPTSTTLAGPVTSEAATTVTVTVTVPPSTVWKTMFTTVPVESMPTSTNQPALTTSTKTVMPLPASTVITTVTLHVTAASNPASGSSTSSGATTTNRPTETPSHLLRRHNWHFGKH